MDSRENEYKAYMNGLGTAMIVSLLFFTAGVMIGREHPLSITFLFILLVISWGNFIRFRFDDLLSRKGTTLFGVCLLLSMLNLIFLALIQFHVIHLPLYK
jgi:hypothetical protein